MPGSKFNFKRLFKQIAIFFAILGPGIITGSVDNDAGGITTYSVAGAMYGYGLIWTLIPSFVLLLIIQEMNARMGIVTGKGLADLIRENGTANSVPKTTRAPVQQKSAAKPAKSYGANDRQALDKLVETGGSGNR